MNYNFNFQPYMPQPIICDVNNLEEAKSFILHPNQTAILKDKANNTLYEKIADNMGNCKMQIYSLVQEKKIEYATKEDLLNLEKTLLNKLGGTTNE